MKGTIHYCLEDSIITYFGQEAWGTLMYSLGKDSSFSYGTHIRDDIDEVQSIELFVLAANSLGLELGEVFDMFGEHWCVEYSTKLYGVFYRGMHSTKDAITQLDHVHAKVTEHIQGAYPPRFEYEWINEETLQVKYKSDRNLIDLFISLIKGLDLKFDDYTIIDKLDGNLLHLTFGQKDKKRGTFKEYLEAKTA